MSAQWGCRLSKSLLNQHRPTATGHGILSSLPFPCFFGSRLPAEVDITIKPSFIAAVPSRWCVSAILICLDLASSSFEAVDGATGDLIRCSQMRPAAAAVWIALFLPGKLQTGLRGYRFMFDDVVVFRPCPACCTSVWQGRCRFEVGCFCIFVFTTLLLLLLRLGPLLETCLTTAHIEDHLL
jgi:hypothetical protein